jgi:hypothetical protein
MMAENHYNNTNWEKLASDIERAVEEAYNQLINLSEDTLKIRPNPGEWSVKEIVGHLTDSAANNHQRFVRLQIADGLIFPNYAQDNDAWVSIQGYQEAPWDDLLALWRYLNRHLARVVRTVNERCIDNIWVLDEDTSITLGDLMIDYLRHLKEHLLQISENIESKDPDSEGPALS